MLITLSITLIFTLIIIIWIIFIRPLSYFKRIGVKQTNPWPIFGDFGKVLFRIESLIDHLSSVYNKDSNCRYIGYYHYMKPTLMLKDPELIKQITVKDFDYFTDHGIGIVPESDPIWCKNIFTLKGQQWKNMRTNLSPSFTSGRIKYMFNIVDEITRDFVDFFVEKNEKIVEIQLKETVNRLSGDIIISSAFGIKINSLREPNNTVFTAGRRITSGFDSLEAICKVILFSLLPKLYKFLNISALGKKDVNLFQNIINETIKYRTENGIVREDMLNLLLEVRKKLRNKNPDDENGFNNKPDLNQLDDLSDEDIAGQALVFFFAGFDTVAKAVCLGLYEMVVNKDIQDKLRKEILETHKTTNGKLTYDALYNMKYLNMVISEILRKWPPAETIDRICTKNYVIEPKYPNEVPVELKVGSALILPFYNMHRDPKFFPNPDKFDPERFAENRKHEIIPYTYLPFGSGPRICLAKRFALFECKTMLYHILLNFELIPVEKSKTTNQLNANSLRSSVEENFWIGLKRIEH